MTSGRDDPSITLTLGHEELVIRQRYETASILNDFLIAIWFMAGSIAFMLPNAGTLAAWLFVVGSTQFLMRPAIRLARRIHLQHVPQSRWDF